MHNRQIESKEWRTISLFFDAHEIGGAVLKEMQKPYFKEEYRGKLTRRTARLLRKAERVERRVDVREVFNLLG